MPGFAKQPALLTLVALVAHAASSRDRRGVVAVLAGSGVVIGGICAGQLIGPDDPDYDAAWRVHNGMIDRHPRLIARCRDVADVISRVDAGRNAGLTIAVRSGAHNAAGLGTVDDGLVIDLPSMRGVRVDPAARTVQVECGCVWGDVDHATHAFGLATPSGFISTTGVGGLMLGAN